MNTKLEKILIVDDNEAMRELLACMVAREGFFYSEASSADEAISLLQKEPYALMISDINMPGQSGLDLLNIVHTTYRDLAAIMVTAVNDRTVAMQCLQVGAYGYITKPFERNELIFNVANALRRRELEIESRRKSEEMEMLVSARTRELLQSRSETIYKLARTAEFRDNETAWHTIRMGHLCEMMAKKSAQPRDICENMGMAAPLHDVGKIGIADAILLKPGKLTTAEFEVMKQHAEIGYRILSDSQSESLKLGAVIAMTHHEKFNGTGYPGGLSGNSIPVVGRIAAICDVFDALTSKRVYKEATPVEEALDIMKKERGEHFDPDLLDLFVENIGEAVSIKAAFQDEEQVAP
jgi:putative two-component system response regulator